MGWMFCAAKRQEIAQPAYGNPSRDPLSYRNDRRSARFLDHWPTGNTIANY